MTDARTLYRESAVRGASPVRLVVLLYEQIVEDLRRAAKAIDEKRIAKRTDAINHAILIIGHLQSKLNHEAGGEVARNLERFYNQSRQKLLEAQCQGSKDILSEQISLLLELRDAWTVVDQAEARSASLPVRVASAASAATVDQKVRADWNG
jgi:flagellar protein FliS